MSAETIKIMDQTAVDIEFADIWAANDMSSPHNQIIQSAIEMTDLSLKHPESALHTVRITDVTLRDGQQQRTDEVTVDDRIEVFDNIVQTGVDRIEIGHLGNANGDQQLATAIVGHIAEKERAGEEDYTGVKLQVLFGSQEVKIQEGIGVLEQAFKHNYGEDWKQVMAEKVVVHVYDRVSEGLRNTATQPYTAEQSAERIVAAADHAIQAGFTQFSVSGEGATAETPETAIQFHRSINEALFAHGAVSVNANLANTFGYSTNENWNTETLATFNHAVKAGYGKEVTTSIHTHNDYNSAADFSMKAVVAGFDRVEGAHIGMGERTGNVSSMDFVASTLEQSMHAAIESERPESEKSRIGQIIGRTAVRGMIRLDPRIGTRLTKWHAAGQRIAEIFGEHAQYRFDRTIVGGPYNMDNGSGPHDQAMVECVRDPVNQPIWRTYEGGLIVSGIMGRPDAEDVAVGDPDAARKVTVANHASGGKTPILVSGEGLNPASPKQRDIARRNFRVFAASVLDGAVNGTMIRVS